MLWKEYEIFVFNYLRSRYANAIINRDIKIKGIYSKRLRQVDTLITLYPIELDVNVVVECKYYNKLIGLKTLDAFLSYLDDIKISKGVLVSNKGFTSSAIERANNSSKDIQLWELGMNTIKAVEGLHIATIINNIGLLFVCPTGWTVEAERKNEPTILFPNGLTIKKANELDEWMFIDIDIKNETIKDINAVISEVTEYSRDKFPNVQYKLISEMIFPLKLQPAKSLMRSCEYKKGLFEFSYFLDYNNLLITYVLCSPRKKVQEYYGNFMEIIESSMTF